MGTFSFKNDHGFWMRVIRLSHPHGLKPDITLLPMIHIAEPDFYQEMNYEAVNHDVVYYEGCWFPGRKLLSFFYKAAAVRSGLGYQGAGNRSKNRPVKLKGHSVTNRLELDEYVTTFPCFCRKCPAHSVRSIRADLHKRVARHAIKNIPLIHRLLSPLIIMGLLFVGMFVFTRKAVLGASLEDMNPSDVGPILAPFWKFIIDDRDYFLQSVLHSELENVRTPDQSLCVKYGKAHMEPLVAFLKREWGYEIVSRRNVLAVKADKTMVLNHSLLGYGVAKARFETRFAHKAGRYDMIMPQAKPVHYPAKIYEGEENKIIQKYLEFVDLTYQDIASSTMCQQIKGKVEIRNLSLSYAVEKADEESIEINFAFPYLVEVEDVFLLNSDLSVGEVNPKALCIESED